MSIPQATPVKGPVPPCAAVHHSFQLPAGTVHPSQRFFPLPSHCMQPSRTGLCQPWSRRANSAMPMPMPCRCACACPPRAPSSLMHLDFLPSSSIVVNLLALLPLSSPFCSCSPSGSGRDSFIFNFVHFLAFPSSPAPIEAVPCQSLPSAVPTFNSSPTALCCIQITSRITTLPVRFLDIDCCINRKPCRVGLSF